MPRIVGLVEHVETSAEVQQWLMEQEEGVSVTMVGVAKNHVTASAIFFRENVLRMRQSLMTFLGSLECTVHVIITPLYHYVIWQDSLAPQPFRYQDGVNRGGRQL